MNLTVEAFGLVLRATASRTNLHVTWRRIDHDAERRAREVIAEQELFARAYAPIEAARRAEELELAWAELRRLQAADRREGELGVIAEQNPPNGWVN